MFSSDERTKLIQNEFLNAFKYFHSICVSNEIKYSLHAGSLLGAIREKGFIPWDDDIDVSMTRENYEKFKKVVNTIDLEKDFSFDDYTSRMPHVCLKREGMPLVWITIFVYDFISENVFKQKLKMFIIGIEALTLSPKETFFNNQKRTARGKIKNSIERVIWVLGSFTPREKRLKFLEWFYQNALVGKKKFVFRANDLNTSNGMRIILPARIMDEYLEVPFEDTVALVTTKYHEVLTSSYGNYMVPEEDTSKTKQHMSLRNRLDR